MGTDKRQRQKEGRQARIAAAEAAQRKAATRQRIILRSGGILLLVLLVGAGISLLQQGRQVRGGQHRHLDRRARRLQRPGQLDHRRRARIGRRQALRRAADPLPAGAPNVPVQVGPPPTTLVKQDLVVGTGAEVQAGDTVTVNYIGVSCSTGKIFDSSYTRGQPATFSLDQVIPGWTQGIPGMKVGGQRLLGIPSDLAYGAQGSPAAASPRTRRCGSWSTSPPPLRRPPPRRRPPDRAPRRRSVRSRPWHR